jgi:hypothetical protein
MPVNKGWSVEKSATVEPGRRALQEHDCCVHRRCVGAHLHHVTRVHVMQVANVTAYTSAAHACHSESSARILEFGMSRVAVRLTCQPCSSHCTPPPDSKLFEPAPANALGHATLTEQEDIKHCGFYVLWMKGACLR